MKKFLFSLFTLTLSANIFAYTVSGTAIDAETGIGLPGIELDLILEGGVVRFLSTDNNGVFEFNNIPNGQHELIFHYYEPVIINGDYYLYTVYPDSIYVDGADVVGIEFNITPHHPVYHVSGTLYDATTNQPLSGQNMSLRLDFLAHIGFFFAWAEDDGTYSFEDPIPDWTYDFNVFDNDYYYGDEMQLVIDTTGPTEITIDFYLQQKDGVTVSGQLFDIETNEPIMIANRTVKIQAINSYFTQTNDNGEFIFVNVDPGYYANIKTTTEDTAYINCEGSVIYNFIVPDEGLSGVELFQEKFNTVHKVSVDDSTFYPGEVKTLRFSLVYDDDIYGEIWGVELDIPGNIEVLNINPFINYRTGNIAFEYEDYYCSSPNHPVWEGYHTVYGSGNAGNLNVLNDSVYTDLVVLFDDVDSINMDIFYKVIYSYACTGGPFSYGSLYLENASLAVGIQPEQLEVESAVYPNPASEFVTINFVCNDNHYADIVLYDIDYRKVMEISNRYLINGSNDILFDVRGLDSGMYFYRINTGRKTITGKILVRR